MLVVNTKKINRVPSFEKYFCNNFFQALGLRKDDTFSTTMLGNCPDAMLADEASIPFSGR